MVMKKSKKEEEQLSVEIDQQITVCLSFRRRKNKNATLCLKSEQRNEMRGVLPWSCRGLMSLTGPAIGSAFECYKCDRISLPSKILF